MYLPCCSPCTSVRLLANSHHLRNVRVFILTRIRPQPSCQAREARSWSNITLLNWFPHSALLLLLTDLEYGDVCVWVPFFTVSSAIPTLWMIQCYHPSFSYWRCGTGQPFTLPCLFCLCVVVVLLVWTVYWSCVSSTFAAHLRINQCATCNLACWTTWRKPRGLGRKKHFQSSLHSMPLKPTSVWRFL